MLNASWKKKYCAVLDPNMDLNREHPKWLKMSKFVENQASTMELQFFKNRVTQMTHQSELKRNEI